MVTLRPYQNKFVHNLRMGLAEHRKVIGCAATGSGKTKVFLSIIRAAIANGTTVIVITEASKIYKQIQEEIGKIIEIKAGVRYVWVEPNGLYLAMAQTLIRRPHIIEQFAVLGRKLLVITDEAHVGTSAGILRQIPEAYHIGFTATPDYRAAKHLPEIYNGIVVGPQPDELVQLGFLSPYFHFERKSADLAGLQKDSRGDFSESSQERVFETAQVYDGLIDDLRTVPYKKAIVYCSSIKHCRKVSDQLREHGYRIAEVHSGLPDNESDFNLAQFMAGPVDICTSVGILTKGFDFPDIDLVVLQRATASLPLYLQMVGRGSRIAPGKKRFTVLDYGGNASRHGPWNWEHDWETMWKPQKNKKNKGEGLAPVKECPECGCVVHTSVKVCPNCSYEWGAGPDEEKELIKDSVMVDVTELYNKIRGRWVGDLTPEELAVYAKSTNKKAYAQRVAKAKEQQQPGFLHQFALQMGYKPGWEWTAQMQLQIEIIEFHDIVIK